ncbi:hypothetical protein FB555_001884 [Alpinimonas psychrophila]|uniref:Uncharacterized protein n=1 Tax=Alpinimonas psychrophila TaxID=748908 RepID=A0A7W3JV15_9MICO|nr:hypothetical protein [Alpinimonas psychrophila]
MSYVATLVVHEAVTKGDALAPKHTSQLVIREGVIPF